MELQEEKERDEEKVLKILRGLPEVELVTEPGAKDTWQPYTVLLKAGKDISMDVMTEITRCLQSLGHSKVIMRCSDGGLVVYGMVSDTDWLFK